MILIGQTVFMILFPGSPVHPALQGAQKKAD